MKLGILYSGGKDSNLALARAMEKEEPVCLISICSKNPDSFMYHTPNIELTRLQAKAIGLMHVLRETEGKEEEELEDLKEAIRTAISKCRIKGVVTGAIESVYQAARVQRICFDLGLWCFNPLWQMDQEEVLKETLKKGFKTIISGVSAYPFDESWLGRRIDEKAIEELLMLRDTAKISPSGEGGEIETSVLDAPFFSKRIRITEALGSYKNYSGRYIIKEARLEDKKQ